jgi:hypothetical protein
MGIWRLARDQAAATQPGQQIVDQSDRNAVTTADSDESAMYPFGPPVGSVAPPNTTSEPVGASAEHAPSSTIVGQYSKKLTRYIPDDVLAIYIAGYAIVSPHSVWAKATILAAAFAVLLLLAAWGVKFGALSSWSNCGKVVLVGTVAFTAYVAAIPGNVFAAIGLPLQWGGFIVIVVGIALPLFGQIVGIDSFSSPTS